MMKKKLALLLALVIAFGSVLFAGCGNNGQTKEKKTTKDNELKLEDIIEGSWEFKISAQDLMDYMYEADEEMQEILQYCNFSKVDLSYTFTFDDGEFEITADMESAVAQMRKPLINGMKDYYEEELGQTLSDQELEELKDNIDYYLESDLDDLDGVTMAGYYRISGKKIYIAEDEDDLEDAEDYIQCSIQSRKVIKVIKWKSNNDDVFIKEMVPFIMTKQ